MATALGAAFGFGLLLVAGFAGALLVGMARKRRADADLEQREE